MNFAPNTFTYGTFFSDTYGLRFAHFDTSEPGTVGGGYTYNTFYSNAGHRRYITTAHQTEENCLEFDIEIMADNGLYESDDRAVYNSLFNSITYKELKVSGNDGIDYYLNCIFTEPERILGILDGQVGTIGYKCTLVADSAWFWKEKEINITGSGSKTATIETDIKDYTNPKITLTIGSTGGTISITNTSDNSRITSFESISPNTTITMEPEYCKITYTGTGNIWTKFYHKHFLRLLPGLNNLTISGDVSSMKIEYKEAHIL